MKLLKAPLLHFLLLGSLIFLFAEWHASRGLKASLLVRVSDKQVTYLQNLYRVQFGELPDETMTRALVNKHIREEVLFREALKAGLAQQDEIIRRRLVQKMEFLIQDNNLATTPADEVLINWFEANSEAFLRPASVSFRHLYFVDGAAGEPLARAQTALKALAGQAADQAAVKADRFPLSSAYHDLSPSEATRLFGNNEFSAAIFELAAGQWAGPYQSGYGWHLLYIDSRQDAQQSAFDDVRAQVLAGWQEEQRQVQYEASLQALEAAYIIERGDW